MTSLRKLVTQHGQLFSSLLGIDLKSGRPNEIFKWFIASLLFGARITETIVLKTYKEFDQANVLTPDGIVATGWDGLVALLDKGGYVRYDFKTADKLLAVVGRLKAEYEGNLNKLHSQAPDPRDLERRLMQLGKGVGPVTAGIFLRELRGIWEMADPLPQELTVVAAKELGFTRLAGRDDDERARILNDLKNAWKRGRVKDLTFANFEAALVRIGREIRQKKY